MTVHKEETRSRKHADASDRKKKHNKLATRIDPLQADSHPSGLVNIVSGRIPPDDVNFDNSVECGTQQMQLHVDG